jgi:hypothetical protein
VLLVPAGIVNSTNLRAVTQAVIPLLLFKTLGSASALQKCIHSMQANEDATLFEYLRQAFTHYRIDLRVPPVAAPERLVAFQRPTLILASWKAAARPDQESAAHPRRGQKF